MWWRVVVAVLCVSVCHAQLTSSFPPKKRTITDDGNMYKHNFCNVTAMVLNGTLTLRQALRGRNLSFVILDGAPWIQYNATTGIIDAGYHFELLNELAQLGGFNWEFSVLGPKPADLSWTDWLITKMKLYDAVVGDWTDIASRRARGATFPFHITDGSFILVSQKNEASGGTKPIQYVLFSFFDPFENELWLLIIGAVLFTALAYWFVEFRIKGHDDFASRNKHVGTITGNRLGNMGRSLYLSTIAFTGGGGYTPKTPFGRIITLSWSFTLLLIIAAYTANLASFLVTTVSETTLVESVKDIIEQNGKVCVWEGTGQHESMKKNSQFQGLQFHGTKDNNASLYALREGACLGAAMGVADWQQYKFSKANWNADRVKRNITGCDMKWVGLSWKSVGASWVLESDSYAHCTSLVSDVLGLLFTELADSGKLGQAWKKHVDAYADEEVKCTPLSASGESLTVTGMGGIFILHGALSFISIVGAFLYRRFVYNGRAERKKAAKKAAKALEESGLSPTKGGKKHTADHAQEEQLSTMAQTVSRLEQQLQAMQEELNGVVVPPPTHHGYGNGNSNGNSNGNILNGNSNGDFSDPMRLPVGLLPSDAVLAVF